MAKKLSSLEDLKKIHFDDLAPDPIEEAPKKEVFIKQYLEAHFSNKGRAGKTVTVIKGFKGEKSEIKKLAKDLKSAVGVGGSIKNGELIIQGNFRAQLMTLLIEMGHDVKRVGG